MADIPDLDDILKHPEDFFELDEDLDQFNPYQFYSYNQMLDKAKEYIIKRVNLGPAIYYLSLILKIDGLYDKKNEEELNEVEDRAYTSIKTAEVIISLRLSSRLKEFMSAKEITKLSKEEKIILLEKYSPHYQKYLRLKEKFGTDYTPSI
ncbi:hypothetical protein DRQ29_00730 [bacterium]|nr:MAG: hypothetical protein DRQ29_00730 [bacterium]